MRTFLAQFLFECSPIQFTGAAPEPKTCQLKFLFLITEGWKRFIIKTWIAPPIDTCLLGPIFFLQKGPAKFVFETFELVPL